MEVSPLFLVLICMLAWISSTVAVALALYVRGSVRSTIASDVYEIREELLGVEHRLSASLDKKLNIASNQMREVAQNDAVELFEAVAGGNPDPHSSRQGLDIASFRNVR